MSHPLVSIIINQDPSRTLTNCITLSRRNSSCLKHFWSNKDTDKLTQIQPFLENYKNIPRKKTSDRLNVYINSNFVCIMGSPTPINDPQSLVEITDIYQTQVRLNSYNVCFSNNVESLKRWNKTFKEANIHDYYYCSILDQQKPNLQTRLAS